MHSLLPKNTSRADLFFEDIFRLQYTPLCRMVNNIIRNEKSAEDIVQDMFFKLWDKRHELNIGNYRAYLYRMATNAAIDHLKSCKTLISFKKIHENYKADGNAEFLLSQKELQMCVEKALRLLPPRCRAIFVMSRYHGLKYKEIAGQLNISVKTVENQMGIALARMRRELKPFLNPEPLNRETISLC